MSNINNKNRFYELERIAVVVVVVLALIITALVVFATNDKGRDESDSQQSTPIDGILTGDSGESEQSDYESGGASTESKPVTSNEEILFESITINNSELNKGSLVLVNQNYEYTDAGVEGLLVNAYKEKVTNEYLYVLSNTSVMLRADALHAVGDMLNTFKEDTGLSNLMVSNAYIDKQSQQSSYDASAGTIDRTELPYLQKGGFSEHQTGLAFHLSVYPASEGEMGEGTHIWFFDNSWKYGFILRYPEGKENITQCFADNTHFRYVGVPHASYMYRKNLVLEEYLLDLQSTDHEHRLRLDVGSADNQYETYAVKAEAGATTSIMVPAASTGWKYEISGCNNGYFVVTIEKNN